MRHSLLSCVLVTQAALASSQALTTTYTSTTRITITTTVATSTTTAYPKSSSSDDVARVSPPTATASAFAMIYTNDLASAILNSTNYYRANFQASPLVWNATLAEFAKGHSQKCLWEHSGGPYGENLAENYISPAAAVDAWAHEEVHYDYRRPRFSEATGHFTQLVWKDTTSVGCGITQCRDDASDGANGWFLVCEYSPRGNVVGAFKTQVTKLGESVNGTLGFGEEVNAASSSARARVLPALAAVYVLLHVWA